MGGEDRMTANHPTGERLIAFASGELHGADAIAMVAHMEACPGCAGTVARYRLVRDVLSVAEAALPPPELVARAKDAFGAFANPELAPRPDRLEPLRRVIAELVFDSGAGLSPALAGFRGGGDRHLTYVAGAVQVDVRVRAPEDQSGPWRVQGQVDADKLLSPTAVDLVSAGEEHAVARTTTDEYGMFDLAAPAGRYDMLVRLPCALQVLPGLVLG